MKIALVASDSIKGGVATFFNNIYRGLISEGNDVDLILIRGRNIIIKIIRDIFNIKRFKQYDLILYLGSIPYLSHLIAKIIGVPIVLVVHGFVYHELFDTIFHRKGLKSRIGALVFLIFFMVARLFNTIDLFVCPSLTVCEANKIRDRFVLLPQIIFSDELKITRHNYGNRKRVRLIAFTSQSNSPRLMNLTHLFYLAKRVKSLCNRRFEIVIVDPTKNKYSEENMNINSSCLVKVLGYMPRTEFLQLLASSDLYIERGIDEDLGQTVLEAMALGIPVAKLTHHSLLNRQDYKDSIIHASSFTELCAKVSEFINNIEYYYDKYSKSGKEFVLQKRSWNVVKGPFLSAIKNISKRKQ